MAKIAQNYEDIVQCEQLELEDADTAILCYGGTMRAALDAMAAARAKGEKVGIFRPITLLAFSGTGSRRPRSEG